MIDFWQKNGTMQSITDTLSKFGSAGSKTYDLMSSASSVGQGGDAMTRLGNIGKLIQSIMAFFV